MDMSSTINRHFQQTKGQFYQNSGYCDSRIDKQILNLNIRPNGTTFDHDLYEPLNIDTLSDVYLDNFVTLNGPINTSSERLAYVLSIDQFSIKSNSNNSNLFNKIVIPNEASTSNILQVHKARKMNYICSINPQTLTKISGSITDLNNDTIGDFGLITTGDALLPSITTNTSTIATGTHTGLATTSSGNGTGAILTIVASGTTVVTGVTVTTPGSGYTVGDTLTVTSSLITGSSTDLVFTLKNDDLQKCMNVELIIVSRN
jgi:hypothetical protein